jgi:plastocyanin
MKKIIALSLASIGVLILGGCGGGNQMTSSNMPSAPQTPAQSSNQTNNSSAAINIQNFAFNPASLTISKGTTVTWTNNDSAPHQIKSTTFNSSPLSQGQTFSFTFNDVGTFNYSCAIHPSMLGKIIVQ